MHGYCAGKEIHHDRRGRCRDCADDPLPLFADRRRQGAQPRFLVSRDPFRRGLGLRGVQDRRPLPAAPGGAAAARDRRQAELQSRPGQVRDAGRPLLGHRRIHGRAVGCARTRLPRAQSRPAMDQLRPHQAAPHLGGHLRLRRQRPDREFILCRATDEPRPPRGVPRAVVRRPRLQLLHRHRRHRLPPRHHRGQGIRRTGMVRGPLADRRLGGLPARLSSARSSGGRNRTSMSPTGSSSPSS